MRLNEEVKNNWDKLGHGRREDLRAADHQMIPVFMSMLEFVLTSLNLDLE